MNSRPRAHWAFRMLLRLFPVEFLRDFGTEMEREFYTSLSEAEGVSGKLVVWRRMVWDVTISVPREHWDTWIGTDGGNWKMGGLIQDAGRALRSLGKSPGFTAVVLLTLGLGIGATTAIYSVVHGVLLAPLPYPDPDRIVTVNERFEGLGGRGAEKRQIDSRKASRDGSSLLLGSVRTGGLCFVTSALPVSSRDRWPHRSPPGR